VRVPDVVQVDVLEHGREVVDVGPFGGHFCWFFLGVRCLLENVYGESRMDGGGSSKTYRRIVKEGRGP
jgi:hypothetical protein